MNDIQTQNDAILAWLETGAGITPLDALHRFGCFRLGARIFDLRRRGWEIDSTMVKTVTGKRIALYKLKSEQERIRRAVGL
jgi:hypothetical protein